MKTKIKIEGNIAFIRDDGETIILCNGIEEGRIWIGCEGGEGGDFNSEEVFEWIDNYYKKHF